MTSFVERVLVLNIDCSLPSFLCSTIILPEIEIKQNEIIHHDYNNMHHIYHSLNILNGYLNYDIYDV